MAAVFLLGLELDFAEAKSKTAVKARADIKKAEPVQAEKETMALTAQQKIKAQDAKIDIAISTNRVIEVQRPNGKPAQVTAAEDAVALQLAKLTAAQIQLAAANDDLAVPASLVEVWGSNLDDATVGLTDALADWTSTETSAAAKAVRDAVQKLLATAMGMSAQIGAAPASAGDDMAVHLNVLIVWRSQLAAAVVEYTTARNLWGGGASGPGLALVEAGTVMLATVTALDAQLADFALVAQVAQTSQKAVDFALAELEGAQAALSSLNASGSARGALSDAVAMRNALLKKAQIAAAAASQVNAAQAARRRKAG